MLRKLRERIFRHRDTPFESRAVDLEASSFSRLPSFMQETVSTWTRQAGRKLDALLRPDMTAILLARSVAGKSMLHIASLLALYECASKCRGAILEIGAYVGGGTIMMASAMIRAGNHAPIIAIEVGGANDNALMPSHNIIKDLRANLHHHRVAQRVSIVEGWSSEVVDQVERLLGDDKIGLLTIDADGNVRRDVDTYRRFLAPNAMIVIDDYMVNEPNSKAAVVYSAVEQMVAERLLRKTKIVPWGTWFGTYRA
jgi:predicted O-methyltransferase YrrM